MPLSLSACEHKQGRTRSCLEEKSLLYEAHFGLSARPFVETVAPHSLVALASREATLRRLRFGLERGSGPALLFGPSGVGKTLLARVLGDELGGPSVHLAFPAMPAAELLAYLADEFAVPAASGVGLAGAVRRLRTYLAAAVAKGTRPLLVVDEAHLIDDSATFESLRLLLNFASAGPPDLALLFVAAPEVLLHLPHSLLERLGARCLLAPLSEEESAQYVTGRLSRAGASQPLFSSDALLALHDAAEGIPRRLNRLADLSLLIAYARELDRPDLETVSIAERECGFDVLAA
jgi:type II secretory pathway predicted ATPase ExeA